jgi:hypothetical protein
MSASWKSLIPSALRKSFNESIIALVLFAVDPLGAGAHLERTVDRWIAVATQFINDSSGADNIAVVLINQETLDEFRHDWPLPYGVIADLGKRLVCAGARAIFFDLSASRRYETSDDDRLEAMVAGSEGNDVRCAAGNVHRMAPIYFANIPGVVSSVQDRLNKANKTFMIRTEQAENTYPAGPAEFMTSQPSSSEVTPAFGLLRLLCGDSAMQANLRPTWCPRDTASAYAKAPIFLSWNGNPPRDQMNVSNSPECKIAPVTLADRILSGLRFLFIESAGTRCPPVLTLVGADLYRDYLYIDSHGVDPARFLDGRVVFVGVDLDGLNDHVQSPVHGQMAGVFFHAVGFENLLDYGDSYYERPADKSKWLVTFAFFFGGNLLLDRFFREGRRWWGFGSILGWVGLFAVIIYVLRWPGSFLVSLIMYIVGSDLLYEAVELRLGRQRQH